MKAPIDAKVECFFQHSSACRIARFLIVALALGATPVLGQTPPTTARNLTEGTKIYAQRCAGCHGADARGTDKAPGRSEEHTSELQSHSDLVCRLLLEKKKNKRLDGSVELGY